MDESWKHKEQEVALSMRDLLHGGKVASSVAWSVTMGWVAWSVLDYLHGGKVAWPVLDHLHGGKVA